jgi:RNA polymerase sigma factor (sigma-70 family)
MGWLGAKRSIEQLVEAHYEALYRFAYRLSGTAAEAEDLTQETFCQAQGKFSQLREPARAKAWLFTILRNVYLHKLRAQRREQVLPPEIDIPERLPEPLPEVDPEQLQRALGELPEDFRTPLLLFYFEEFSYREIAEQMQVPLGTVMSRLARAKMFLRGRLFTYQAAMPAPTPGGDARTVRDSGAPHVRRPPVLTERREHA